MRSLNKQIKKYCINKLRDDVHLDIEETKDHIEYVTEQPRNLVDEVLKFVNGMTEMHNDVLEEGQQDIMETCFNSYLYKLTEVEEKDIRQLK